MLPQLIQLLQDNGLYITDEIQKLKSSCCPSSTQVIDYDKVKDKYCKKTSIGTTPKSADALLINAKTDKISFLEMKAFLAIFEEIKTKNYTLEEAKTRIEYAFKIEFEADKKILDSVMLLLDIVRHFKLDHAFFPYFISDDCKKEFYFVLGCSQNDFVKWYFSILPLTYKYEYFKLGQAKFIPASNFSQYFP